MPEKEQGTRQKRVQEMQQRFRQKYAKKQLGTSQKVCKGTRSMSMQENQ